ncbi:hypothetical protein N7471_005635 [Penicillium samsonianum]|uniref:uncharacterized protein n=1 Tax=Penicillium samsonianum TaxID=1882272 RepID=UPI002547DD9E|nr:uncharacterized protein N7471_005635 [Penicillium samsonianum]KAJ6139149.1 hypothetical protein N7471_005635 [Penicillium samsonianum]
MRTADDDGATVAVLVPSWEFRLGRGTTGKQSSIDPVVRTLAADNAHTCDSPEIATALWGMVIASSGRVV